MDFLKVEQTKPWMVAARLEKRSLLIAVNGLAGMSIFFFGYDQGLMGGVNQSTDYIHRMGLGYLDSNGNPVITETLLQGGIMAIFYLGTLVGCLAGGAFGDKYGRIGTIRLGAAWAIFGASLQSAAMNPTWMLGSRFVNGIGTGILNGIVPAWASELSDYTSRGTFIAMEFTLNIFGVVVAYWLAYGVSFIDNGESEIRWRFPIAFQILPLLFLLFVCWAFPESPRWLVKAGRDQEALYVLQRLRGTDSDRPGVAEAEYNDIRNVIEFEKSSEGTSYIHMLLGIKSGRLHTGRRVQLVIWLQINQCWTGIAGVTMYGPTIFQIAGFGSSKTQWVAGLNNIFYMFSTLICVFTIDRIGRRWTLYWGSVGQAIAMFLVGGLSRGGLNARVDGNDGLANQWGAAAASMVYLYTFIFGATWLTVPWLYPAEIFPIQVRAKGNSWGVVGWSIGNGTLTLLLPYIVDAINEKMMYIFATVNVLSIPIVYALYPESNQRTLEEMDLLFAASTPWAWDAERTFATLKEETGGIGGGVKERGDDIEAKGDSIPAHHVESS
ncbi:general substrate transporter [Dactylonectria macrodidyma]|uniref:General substrate transporter n=1 Tax=Dactylonectria macrodidyma TaxID=307937 RepID=A0A9P9IYY0_9HYPO|nr:general substrate transporter [Dactylonectria macrodidyma]